MHENVRKSLQIYFNPETRSDLRKRMKVLVTPLSYREGNNPHTIQ